MVLFFVFVPGIGGSELLYRSINKKDNVIGRWPPLLNISLQGISCHLTEIKGIIYNGSGAPYGNTNSNRHAMVYSVNGLVRRVKFMSFLQMTTMYSKFEKELKDIVTTFTDEELLIFSYDWTRPKEVIALHLFNFINPLFRKKKPYGSVNTIVFITHSFGGDVLREMFRLNQLSDLWSRERVCNFRWISMLAPMNGSNKLMGYMLSGIETMKDVTKSLEEYIDETLVPLADIKQYAIYIDSAYDILNTTEFDTVSNYLNTTHFSNNDIKRRLIQILNYGNERRISRRSKKNVVVEVMDRIFIIEADERCNNKRCSTGDGSSNSYPTVESFLMGDGTKQVMFKRKRDLVNNIHSSSILNEDMLNVLKYTVYECTKDLFYTNVNNKYHLIDIKERRKIEMHQFIHTHKNW